MRYINSALAWEMLRSSFGLEWPRLAAPADHARTKGGVKKRELHTEEGSPGERTDSLQSPALAEGGCRVEREKK